MTGKIMRTSMLGASCVGILIGAAAPLWPPMAEAQGTFSPALQVQQVPPRLMDRGLAGMRNGVLTRAKDGIVWIDGSAYTFAADALIENRSGRRLQVKDLQWDGVAYDVQYWLGTGSADRQITQLIIIFPE